MLFQLYLLTDTNGLSQYAYAGISSHTTRILQIAEDHIKLLDRTDADFIESEYTPTSRYIDFDLAGFDGYVTDYIHIAEYSILIFFNEYRHMVLNYLSPNNESRKDYDIFDGYPEPKARKLVDMLYPMALRIREQTYAAEQE
ncbi:hypothetical protein [Sediminibacterium soli]|uniref:hypothetical protein n=1 Tax=Sediminibacterium soli TaxID=2698829 RepID=UPI00137AF090|nr:hypothetical protein [Sediminibacterium soli]NCI47249.1 hypothetical protein [Sediminibacterium soli]